MEIMDNGNYGFISWPLTFQVFRLIRLCSCLLLLSEWLCESVPIALRALSTLQKTLHVDLCWATALYNQRTEKNVCNVRMYVEAL